MKRAYLAVGALILVGCGGGASGGTGGGSSDGGGGGAGGGNGSCLGACSATCSVTLTGAVKGSFACNTMASSLGVTGVVADFQPLAGDTDAGSTDVSGRAGNGDPSITFGLLFDGDMKTGSYTIANTTAAGASVTLANGKGWLMDQSLPFGTFGGAAFGNSKLVETDTDGGSGKRYAISGGTFDATLSSDTDAGTLTLHVAF